MFNIYMYLNRVFEQFWGRFFQLQGDFDRFRAFFTRLKIDPFGWAPSSVGCRLAAAILPHARLGQFGFHFGDLSDGIFGSIFDRFLDFAVRVECLFLRDFSKLYGGFGRFFRVFFVRDSSSIASPPVSEVITTHLPHEEQYLKHANHGPRQQPPGSSKPRFPTNGLYKFPSTQNRPRLARGCHRTGQVPLSSEPSAPD
jgi:hypothetical protein